MRKCPATVGWTKDARPRLIYCGQWSCEHCAPHLAKRWAVRAKLHIMAQERGEQTEYYFITLTMQGKYKIVREAFRALPKLWDRLRKSMTRTYGRWHYLAFVEGQPKRGGMPHFHILASVPPNAKPNKHGKVTKHILHDWAHAKGWGFQIEVERVTGGKAASYVAKYSTKQHPSTPKGFRRVRADQRWQKLPRDIERKLIVPARGEDVAHFIARLTDISHLPAEQCYKSYVEGLQMLKLGQSKGDI